uniref:Uncharacterized protein n=2 Tax=Pelagomonas calceolata TaxID=35677 RepID=A0A7S3ZVB9_9STRA
MLSQRVAEAFDAWFARLAAARGVRLVVVGRADVLRLTVSKRHANGSRPVTLPTGRRLLDLLREERRRLEALRALHRRAAARGVASLLLAYEDLVGAGAAAQFRRLEDFLRVGDCAVDARKRPPRNRAHAGHPSTYVANWPAVADTLRGSPFAALVADANDPVAAGPVVASRPPESGPPPPPPPTAAAGFLFFFASGVLVGLACRRVHIR